MQYEIKDQDGIVYGAAINSLVANLFAQSLRERYRDIDFKVHPLPLSA